MTGFAKGEAMTTAEMAEQLDVSENTMRRRLKRWRAAGLVRVVRKRIRALNDQTMTVTAWAIAQSPNSEEE